MNATEHANEEAVRLLKAGEEVPEAIAKIAERIDFEGYRENEILRIPRWRDLAKFVNLRSLSVFNTDFKLADHGAYLSGAPLLMTYLDLRTTSVTDLSPLSALTNLTSLKLPAESVTDLSPLGALTNLTSLRLSAESATDISPLSALTNLTSLDLSINPATDISPLLQLVALEKLTIFSQSAGDLDLAPFETLKNLMIIELWGLRPLNQSTLRNAGVTIKTRPIDPNRVRNLPWPP